MKIAQISPLAESVPPKLYGGTERIVSYLTEELVKQKHDVTLFASGDSRTKARLIPMSKEALRLNPAIKDQLYHHLILIDQIAEMESEFDLIHFHVDAIHLPVARPFLEKTLTTLHGRLDLPDLKPLYEHFNGMPLVSISNAQRKPMPPVRWMNTIYHGLPENLYKPHDNPKDYLAFLGRISPEKGPATAIAIAEQAGIPLKMAAKIDGADREYFENSIKPLLDHPLVEFIGEINDAEKESFLGNALALLFPINWPEPFGLTMIEAMACGTPVIAFNHGSVPELIKPGISGFIVRNTGEAIAALKNISLIDRARVRRDFEERFSATRMARNYISTYQTLLETTEWQRSA